VKSEGLRVKSTKAALLGKEKSGDATK